MWNLFHAEPRFFSPVRGLAAKLLVLVIPEEQGRELERSGGGGRSASIEAQRGAVGLTGDSPPPEHISIDCSSGLRRLVAGRGGRPASARIDASMISGMLSDDRVDIFLLEAEEPLGGRPLRSPVAT